MMPAMVLCDDGGEGNEAGMSCGMPPGGAPSGEGVLRGLHRGCDAGVVISRLREMHRRSGCWRFGLVVTKEARCTL